MSSKEPLPSEVGSELPPLPFTYVRTYDPNEAAYTEGRILPASIVGYENKPLTDEYILGMVKDQREKKDWFIAEDWRRKGKPLEQIEFHINNTPITVYNWNKEISSYRVPKNEIHLPEIRPETVYYYIR